MVGARARGGPWRRHNFARPRLSGLTSRVTSPSRQRHTARAGVSCLFSSCFFFFPPPGQLAQLPLVHTLDASSFRELGAATARSANQFAAGSLNERVHIEGERGCTAKLALPAMEEKKKNMEKQEDPPPLQHVRRGVVLNAWLARDAAFSSTTRARTGPARQWRRQAKRTKAAATCGRRRQSGGVVPSRRCGEVTGHSSNGAGRAAKSSHAPAVLCRAAPTKQQRNQLIDALFPAVFPVQSL